jgi:hypothetical protein
MITQPAGAIKIALLPSWCFHRSVAGMQHIPLLH